MYCFMTYHFGIILIKINSYDIPFMLLVFRVYYERPVVIDSLSLKLRKNVRLSSNVVLDEMMFAKCHLLFRFF